jgi:hypothetical protein
VTGQTTGTSFASTPTLTSANGSLIATAASAGGFNFEGLFGGYTATAIAPGWIATVSHIGSYSTFLYNGVTYNVVPNSGVIVNPASDGTGIELYRIDTTTGGLPTYAQVWSNADGSPNDQEAVITGRGYDKGSPIYAQTTTGDPYQQGQLEGWAEGANNGTLRWGENYVYTQTLGGTPYLQFSFDAPGQGDAVPNEGTLIVGDSGGGVYLYSTVTKQWKLAGLNEGIVNGGPYSTTSNFANPFTASLFDTQGLYTAANQEVNYTSTVGSYYSVGPDGLDYNQVNTVGEMDVSYNLSAEFNAITITQDFTNTSNYTLGGSPLTFNSSNSNTTLGVIAGTTTITPNLSFGNNFTLNVPAGSTLKFAGNVTFASGVTFGSSGAGTIQLKTVRASGLNITNGTVQIAQSGAAASTSIVNSLSISSNGRLDLTNNDLIVNWSGSNPTSTIRSYLMSSYDKGSWDLPGIGTSSVVAGSPLYTLGYADNSLLGDSTFDGQSVNANSVLVKYTYAGDANLDGVVNATDLGMMKANGSSWMQGDFNYDGIVNGDDYSLFMLGLAEQKGAIAPVPEPGVGAVLSAAIGLITLRRRKI